MTQALVIAIESALNTRIVATVEKQILFHIGTYPGSEVENELYSRFKSKGWSLFIQPNPNDSDFIVVLQKN